MQLNKIIVATAITHITAIICFHIQRKSRLHYWEEDSIWHAQNTVGHSPTAIRDRCHPTRPHWSAFHMSHVSPTHQPSHQRLPVDQANAQCVMCSQGVVSRRSTGPQVEQFTQQLDQHLTERQAASGVLVRSVTTGLWVFY